MILQNFCIIESIDLMDLISFLIFLLEMVGFCFVVRIFVALLIAIFFGWCKGFLPAILLPSKFFFHFQYK